MPQVAIFDINETTLDLAPVRRAIDDAVGREGAFTIWFGRLLQMSMAITATGRFRSFGELAPSALGAVAEMYDVALEADAWSRVATAMGTLEGHPDVAGGLSLLADQGWRLIALTNSGQTAVDNQLTGAGLHDRFETVLSVDAVQAFKPSPAPYRHALDIAGVAPEEAVMVACHDWDLAGAKAVGLHTAFIARPGMPFADAFPPPDHRAHDFVALAGLLGEAS